MKKQAYILTLPITNNFGCALQAYALGCVLKEKGYKTIILNKMWNDGNILKKIFARTIGFNSFVLKVVNKQKYFLYSFLKKHLNFSVPIFDVSDFKKVEIDNGDLVVFGSDQIWNPEISPGILFYFGNFIRSKKVKRIAYAASFGSIKPAFTKTEKKQIKKLLKNFREVSVREKDGVKICKENFGVNPLVAIDPTLLCHRNRYLELIKNKKGDRGILSILLQKQSNAAALIKKTAHLIKKQSESKKEIKINSMFRDYNRPFPVEEFLEKIFNSSFVITDSYHGMLFSIIFNKSFLVIPCKRTGGCSSRITTILKLLGLKERFLENSFKLPYKITIPASKWIKVEKKLEKERCRCLKILD